MAQIDVNGDNGDGEFPVLYNGERIGTLDLEDKLSDMRDFAKEQGITSFRPFADGRELTQKEFYEWTVEDYVDKHKKTTEFEIRPLAKPHGAQ